MRMNISEIYEKYQIMPQLQNHMYRVAGVASVICNNFSKPVDKNSVVSACLLHDMGNIIKSDLNLFPEYLNEKGLSYWKNLKKEFIKKYGNNANEATQKICKEFGTPGNVINILKGMGFLKMQKIAGIGNFQVKICGYSDMRVKPSGVTSLNDRLKEGIKRYAVTFAKRGFDSEKIEELISLLRKVEKQIFAYCKIRPEDITEERIKPLIKKFRNFEI